MNDKLETGNTNREPLPASTGNICAQSVNHGQGVCTCQPPTDKTTGQKIDTRTGERYGKKK